MKASYTHEVAAHTYFKNDLCIRNNYQHNMSLLK